MVSQEQARPDIDQSLAQTMLYRLVVARGIEDFFEKWTAAFGQPRAGRRPCGPRPSP